MGKETCSSQPQCSGGQVWKLCGSACTKTCTDLSPVCTKQCVPKCECPSEMPVWENGACVSACPSIGLCAARPGSAWKDTGCRRRCGERKRRPGRFGRCSQNPILSSRCSQNC